MRTGTMILLGLAAAAAGAVVAPAAAGERLHRARGEVGERAGGREWEADEEGEAEEGEARGERAGGAAASATPAVDPTYAKECGACHLAYPPSLLPAASWRKLMSGLDRHFGQNAEVDEPTRAKLQGWLVEHAGAAQGGEPAPLRITDAGWFRHEHREVARRVRKGKPASSFADCAACHAGAARWEFGEGGATIGRE